MTLRPGMRLGPYEIGAPIGAGGMGEVYRALDINLGRDVAIKVLSPAFAQDPDRLARFEREAKTLALLNHPNIAIVHGLEKSESTIDSGALPGGALVMELVEGPTLADRIDEGAIPLDEALAIAGQISEALEAAHDHGVVHRDLKPANIKLRPDGTVKVLDFGLAKALEPLTVASPHVSKSPTITSPIVTHGGMILGTAAYMSPEQAKGRAADKRSDLWAFGCVIYEMLSGRRPFDREDVSETIVAVLRDPPDWRALPADTPESVRRLLRRCLEKDRTRRLSSAADARLEIDEARRPSSAPEAGAGIAASAARRPRRVWFEPLAWSLVTLGLAATVGWTIWRAPVATGLVRTVVALPAPLQLRGGGGDRWIAISPDGRRLAFSAIVEGKSQIYLRHIDQFDPVAVPGTEGGVDPFFSADGRWLGFIGGSQGIANAATGQIRKVSIGGGPATSLTAATNRGAAWGPDDTIVFTPTPTTGLARISAAGGSPEPITTLAENERTHRWPSFLPDGKTVLFSIQTGGASFDDALIAVRSLETGEQRVVARGGTSPTYLPTGHIVFGRAGVLLAMPFDLRRLEATGPPLPVLEGVSMNSGTGAMQYATAAGSLVYIPGPGSESRRELVWIDQQGKSTPVSAEKRPYSEVSLSPDGQRIATGILGGTRDIWAYEIARGTMRRLTFSQSVDLAPVWTPDGRHVTFAGIRTGPMEILEIPLDATGSEAHLLDVGALNVQTLAWHPQGNWLAYSAQGDIYAVKRGAGAKPEPVVATPFTDTSPAFSPDGRWIAYASDESGRFEIYVQPFPGPRGKVQVSNTGGLNPKWGRDGRDLFFRNTSRMMAVSITPESGLTTSAPRVLFEGQYAPSYDVAPDGRFLMIRDERPADPTQLRFVLNWWDDLKQLVNR